MKRMMLKLPDELADALRERCGPRERTSYILAAIRLVDLHERSPETPLGKWTWSEAAATERDFAEGADEQESKRRGSAPGLLTRTKHSRTSTTTRKTVV